MLRPQQAVSLTIEKPVAGGRMLARAEGLVVLVAGAIPGERVRAVIERVGKGVAYAAAIDIEQPSVDRRAAVDPSCGGCLYAHVTYPRQLELKAQVIGDAFGRIGRVVLAAPVHVRPSPEAGYRMRARFHVRDGTVGFFREGTHELCDPRPSQQLLAESIEAVEQVTAAAETRGATVREIELAENVASSDRVIHLEAEENIGSRTLEQLASMDGVTGVSSGAGSAGEVYVTDTVAVPGYPPIALRRHVLAFFQGNRYLLNDLVTHVVEQVRPSGDVLDLYAGVGLFAAAISSARDARVTAVEGDRLSADDLKANAAAGNGGITAVHQPVESFLRGRPQTSTVVIDPPRTGVSREALDRLIALGAPTVVYVSCDVATLARDSRRLIDSGYSIQGVEAFDLFPNTPHVETVVRFNL